MYEEVVLPCRQLFQEIRPKVPPRRTWRFPTLWPSTASCVSHCWTGRPRWLGRQTRVALVIRSSSCGSTHTRCCPRKIPPLCIRCRTNREVPGPSRRTPGRCSSVWGGPVEYGLVRAVGHDDSGQGSPKSLWSLDCGMRSLHLKCENVEMFP